MARDDAELAIEALQRKTQLALINAKLDALYVKVAALCARLEREEPKAPDDVG